MAEGRAKGLLFNYLRDYVAAQDGPKAWDELLHTVDEGDAEPLRGIVLASGWYPIRSWNRVVASQMAKSRDAGVAMARFCSYLGDRELNSFVKFVVKLGWPEFMLKRTGMLWSRYFDQGIFSAEEIEPRRWRLRLEGSADDAVGAGRLTCAFGPGPWLERGLHLAGTKTGRVEHTRCRHDGLPACEFLARW